MEWTGSIWFFLWFAAILASGGTNKDYSKLKLPPVAGYLKEYGKLRPGTEDRYTGCICPPTLNTKGSVYMFCGHEMSPKAGGTCIPEAAYRCVNGQSEAIMELDCGLESVGANYKNILPKQHKL